MESRWHIDLTGEVAVVTGGTRNIGLAIARILCLHGASVCVVGLKDRDALDHALETLGGDSKNITGLLASVADPLQVERIFNHAEANLGPVSILVNAAAHRPHQPFADISSGDWHGVIDGILTAAFYTSQQLFRRLPDTRPGAIINLGGLSAHRPLTDRVHVIAAKTGLEGLTRALAEEGNGRIRANCLVPGAIATERRAGQYDPNKSAQRSGWPLDIARAVLWLADPVDNYFTGQTIHVNGGRFMT